MPRYRDVPRSDHRRGLRASNGDRHGPSAGLGHERPGSWARLAPRHVFKPISTNRRVYPPPFQSTYLRASLRSEDRLVAGDLKLTILTTLKFSSGDRRAMTRDCETHIDFLHTGRRHQHLQLPAGKRHTNAFSTRNTHGMYD